MTKIDINFLTGNENKIYWIDDKNSIYFFYEDYNFLIEHEDSSSISGSFTINDDKLIILNINEELQKYMTIIEESDNEFIFQEFKKEQKENKKILKLHKSNKVIKCLYPSEILEAQYKEKFKDIISKYNYINYLSIFCIISIYFFVILIILKQLPIVSNFPFLFNFLIIIGLSSFIHKPLFLILHSLSNKIRVYIEK